MDDRYLVVQRISGTSDCAFYSETDEADSDYDQMIADMLSGHYQHPIRIEAFNTVDCWADDVSAPVAAHIADEARERGIQLVPGVLRFIEECGARV